MKCTSAYRRTRHDDTFVNFSDFSTPADHHRALGGSWDLAPLVGCILALDFRIGTQMCKSDDEEAHSLPLWQRARAELSLLVRLGWPTSLQMIASVAPPNLMMLFLGHLPNGPVLVAGAGVGSMFCNVAGRSLLVGFQLGSMSLMSQAYGAGNLSRVGLLLQRQWLIHLVLILAVIVPLWTSSHSLLTAAQQPEAVVHYAARFVLLRVPALFGWSLSQSTQNYCIAQRMPRTPAVIALSAQAVLLLLLPLLIYGADLGFDGGPVALTCCDLLAGGLSLVVPTVHPRLRVGFPRLRASWRPALRGWGEMLRLALPSALMQLSEWWAWEVNIFLAGFLCTRANLGSASNSSSAGRLASSLAVVSNRADAVLSSSNTSFVIDASDYCAPLEAFPILSNSMVLVFLTQFGFSVAAGSRVGNLVGAGDVRGAKLTTYVVIGLSLSVVCIFASVLLALRHQLGEIYGLDEKAAQLVARVVPLVCTYVTIDALGPGVSNRVLNGLGKVLVPGIVTFVAFYIIGLPVGIAAAFHAERGLAGLWFGLDVGMISMVTGLMVYLFCVVDWHAASRKARERALAGSACPGAAGGLAAADSASASKTKSEYEMSLPSQANE